jgi:peptide/nickel transport system ATP-binding protein
MSLLEVRDLTVEYHTKDGVFCAVENLNLDLDQGKSLGVVGESGCGKTTAMLAVMRLLPEAGRIVSGQVFLEGVDLLRLPLGELRKYRWKKISMIFQGAMNALNPVRTVGSQIEEVLLLHDTVARGKAKAEVARLLDLVGVSPARANQYPHEYSGGMRQRAVIAMALACQPQVIIADEPTTALDVMVQAQILDLLQELQRELDLSIIMVTHDLGVVAELCDDVLVMYGGRMAEWADIDRIYNHAVHPYTRRLLHAFPDIDDPRAALASIPGHPPPLDNLPPGCRFEPRCGVGVGRCSRQIPQTIEVAPGHLVCCLLAEGEGSRHAQP